MFLNTHTYCSRLSKEPTPACFLRTLQWLLRVKDSNGGFFFICMKKSQLKPTWFTETPRRRGNKSKYSRLWLRTKIAIRWAPIGLWSLRYLLEGQWTKWSYYSIINNYMNPLCCPTASGPASCQDIEQQQKNCLAAGFFAGKSMY